MNWTRVSFLQEKAGQESYDGWVQVGASRRVRARLIAIPVPEEVAIKRQSGGIRKAQKHSRKVNPLLLDWAQWTLLLTNIAPEALSIREALILLRLRWQIELLFKLWKHYGQADTSQSRATLACTLRLLCQVARTPHGALAHDCRMLERAQSAVRSRPPKLSALKSC